MLFAATRYRLGGWVNDRLETLAPPRCGWTPPELFRVAPLVALVWAILEPLWVKWWLAPYLALPGDHFRDPLRLVELEVIGTRGPRRVLARVVPDELVARGWRWDTLPRVDLISTPWCTLRVEVREVDLRGWLRA